MCQVDKVWGIFWLYPLKEKLKDPEVDNKLRFANYLFNNFLIIPLTSEIKNLIVNNN